MKICSMLADYNKLFTTQLCKNCDLVRIFARFVTSDIVNKEYAVTTFFPNKFSYLDVAW